MNLRILTLGLFAVAISFTASFAASFLDPRTPWWGHVIFGVPAVLLGLAFTWSARRYVRS